jgi:hypothetical protein
VDRVDLTEDVIDVYNLTIGDYHTFFIGGRGWGFSVWVHNTDMQCQIRDLERQLAAAANDAEKAALQQAIAALRAQLPPSTPTTIAGRIRAFLGASQATNLIGAELAADAKVSGCPAFPVPVAWRNTPPCCSTAWRILATALGKAPLLTATTSTHWPSMMTFVTPIVVAPFSTSFNNE